MSSFYQGSLPFAYSYGVKFEVGDRVRVYDSSESFTIIKLTYAKYGKGRICAKLDKEVTHNCRHVLLGCLRKF